MKLDRLGFLPWAAPEAVPCTSDAPLIGDRAVDRRTRRPSANAARRAGAARQKVATGAPGEASTSRSTFCDGRRSPTAREDWTSVSRPPSAAFVA